MTVPTYGRLIPVHGTHGYIGHLLQSARGFRACDANDKEIGTYPTVDLAASALLELAGEPAPPFA